MAEKINLEQQEVELNDLLNKATGLINRDQDNETLSFNKSFLDEVENLYKQLESFEGIDASNETVNKYQYVMRFFAETLYIAGRKVKGAPFI